MFKVGDKVRFIKTDGSLISEELIGKVGAVELIRKAYLPIGVNFEEWTGGHNLGWSPENCPRTRTCWWCNPSSLELINKRILVFRRKENA